MSKIIDRIEAEIVPGTAIPKPETDGEYLVKGWGRRRGERALVYTIPNHGNPSYPHEKGIAVSEWDHAFDRLMSTGELRHSWFKVTMPACNTEGSCNFTTIGGIFTLLGLAVREERGAYRTP